ncbi:GNAT family N-acetyltransferase [Novispirillum itersonii]
MMIMMSSVSPDRPAEPFVLASLTADQVRASLEALVDLLADCVEGGASIGFLRPAEPDRLRRYWQGVADAVAAGERAVLTLHRQGLLVGSVQLGLAMPQNGGHRADLGKLLVHRRARGQGASRFLMRAAEAEARRRGRTLIVLDTEAGSLAEGIYRRLGYQESGRIPDFAVTPDGVLHPTVIFHKQLSAVTVRSASPEAPEAVALMNRLSAYLAETFGADGRAGFAAWAEWEDRKVFAMAECAGQAVGCGALLPRPEDPACAEIKRMFADPEYPGTGALVLQYLLDQARALGFGKVCLETRWANQRAIAFYQRHGFRPGPAFSPYQGRPECACLELSLV